MASVLLHALGVIVVAALPGRESPPPGDVERPTFVVELVSLEPSRARPPAPVPEAVAEVPSSDPAAPVAESKSRAPGRRRRSQAPATGEAGPPGAGSGPAAGGLQLKGLRGPKSADAGLGGGVPSGAGARRPALALPVPSEPLDRPQTLSDLGFSDRRGTDLVRDDPSLPFVATIHADGRISFEKRLGFPYEYYRQKTRVQKETFGLRLKLARGFAKRELKRRMTALPRELSRVWNGGGSAKSRRALLFELWDECLESSGRTDEPDDIDAALDRERARMGQRARAQIIGFIARELPPGTSDAYAEAELRALNQRRASRQRFAPYARSAARGKAQ